jgi:serpin B
MNFKFIVSLFTTFLVVINFGKLNAQISEISKSLNQYSFDLYNGTKVEKENLFLSPFSTYYALLSAYEGSKKKQKQSLRTYCILKIQHSLKMTV